MIHYRVRISACRTTKYHFQFKLCACCISYNFLIAGLRIINRGFEKCLTLYPQQSWDPIFSEISKLNDFDPKVREFRRYFLNGATQVELDSAGRLLLPKNLSEHAGLEKDIVLVSAVNKIEIWDKSKYTQFFETFTPQSFSDLANEVMNKVVG